MKIKRDDNKKEKTEDEKKLDEYKKMRRIGLASAGTGAGLYLLSRLKAINKMPAAQNNPDMQVNPRAANLAKWGGIGLGAVGVGLHGLGAIKHNKLKKKVNKEKEDNDNTETKD